MFWLILPTVLLLVLEWWRPRLWLNVRGLTSNPEQTLPEPSSQAVSHVRGVGRIHLKPSLLDHHQSYDTPPDKHVNIVINKARHVSISGQSTPSPTGGGYTIDWTAYFRNGASNLQHESAKEEHDNTKKLISAMQTIMQALENHWGPNAGVEERCTWSKERECLKKIIDDLMQQRSQMEHSLQAMEERHGQEKAALEGEKRQHEEQIKKFVFRVDEAHKQFIGEALSQMNERSLREVVLKLAQDFDVYTLGVDCGLNFLVEVKAEKCSEVLSKFGEIEKELNQVFQHHLPKPMKWHAEETDKDESVQVLDPPKTKAKQSSLRTRSLGSASRSPGAAVHSNSEEIVELRKIREQIGGIIKRLHTQESRHSGSHNE